MGREFNAACTLLSADCNNKRAPQRVRAHTVAYGNILMYKDAEAEGWGGGENLLAGNCAGNVAPVPVSQRQLMSYTWASARRRFTQFVATS